MQFERFLGTGFMIGNRGYALTAAHVVLGGEPERMAAMLATAQPGWRGAKVVGHECHPSEDVAVLQLASGPWRSFFRLSNTWEGSSAHYQMWGYPDDVATELEAQGRVVYRPDLVYAEGYVRRRVTGHSFPSIRGTQLFEVNEVVGPGCSGSPIYMIRRPYWDVIGIYIGERLNDRSTSTAYAVREDAFREWVPSILACSILEEAAKADPGI